MRINAVSLVAALSLGAVSAQDFGFRRTLWSNWLEEAHTTPYKVTKETWLSQSLELPPGHMIFTKPFQTPLEMPTGRYAITGFIGDIVDGQNQSVPLSKVYDHHWIAENNKHHNQLCKGAPEYVFGIGAESRTTPAVLPPGYGVVVDDADGPTKWGGNIHLLHTEFLAGSNKHKAAKECNECYYAPGKGERCTPGKNGTFDCCGETSFTGNGGKCPTRLLTAEEEAATYEYKLRYSLNYTRDVDAITPVQVGVWTTPDCRLFYDVLRNDTHPERVDSTEATVPDDMTIVLAIGHQHTGALNISLFVNDELACASYPTYGTQEDVPGDEKGYLVHMSSCVNASTGPLHLKAGDRVRLDSWYYVGSNDERLAYSDGTHLNVMGYMYTVYHGASGFIMGD